MSFFPGATTIHRSTFNNVGGNQTNHHKTNTNYINIIMDNRPRGIVHYIDDRNLSHLPLEQVNIDVFVVDVSARVTLRQTFVNSSEIATGRAKYIFPVPARAAVCAFEMHFADGRVITGVSKEKGRATKEHEDAVREGKPSGLVDWVTDDIFVISVGSIPPQETVTTNLVFVMDLMDDELKDEVRLQLPMSIGSRYGQEPAALATAASTSSQTCLSITVDIQMSGIIRKVTSPTHSSITVAPHVTSAGHTSLRRQTAKLCSSTFLTENFVLSVRADGLDAPRCFAERDPNGLGTVAMQLTFVPNIKLSPIATQEYLFLVDCSGSMAGHSIEVVKRALVMLLRMLPNDRTFFNIFSFGSNVKGLWPKSQPYDQNCLNVATGYVNSMQANYGGTELRAALDFVFHHRNSHVSTMVFVLTDGQIYAGDEVISVVANAVAQSGPDTPLRIFALGIGHEVSSAVVEGIARAGNGESLFAVENESIENKCARLLRAGRSPCIENVSIDWNIPEYLQNTAHSPFYVKFSNSVHVQLGPPPSVQQSPSRIQHIFPGMRFTVFSLTAHRTIPKQVILQGKLNDGDREIMIVVPVSNVKIFNKKRPDVPLVHTLSARHLITDLVEGQAILPTAMNPATVEDIRKAAVVRLGERYQLASRYTSFVAVYKESDALRHQSRDNQIIDIRQSKRDENLTMGESLAYLDTAPSPGSFPVHLGSANDEQEIDSASTDSSLSQSSLAELTRPWTPKFLAYSADDAGRPNVDSSPHECSSLPMDDATTLNASRSPSRHPIFSTDDAPGPSAAYYGREPGHSTFTSDTYRWNAEVAMSSDSRPTLRTPAPPTRDIDNIFGRAFPGTSGNRTSTSGSLPQSAGTSTEECQSTIYLSASTPAAALDTPSPPTSNFDTSLGIITDLCGSAFQHPYPLSRLPRPLHKGVPRIHGVGAAGGSVSPLSVPFPARLSPRISGQIFDLVQLQNIDGSFPLTSSLGEIVGQSALQKPTDIHADDTAWATALAVAFLRKHLTHDGQSDLLHGILDKVSEFVKKTLSEVIFDSLVERAMGLVQ